MFKCQKCNKMSKPSEPQNKQVVETRVKTYTNFVKEKSEFSRVRREIVSQGTEIVREIVICGDCIRGLA